MTKELYDKIHRIVYPSSEPRQFNTDYTERFIEIALLIDPYFLLKEAQREGKEIQVKPLGSSNWQTIVFNHTFSNPVECYRIKPPAPKSGEYYQHVETKDIYIYTGMGRLINLVSGGIWSSGNDAFAGYFDSFEKVNVEVKLKN